MNINTGSTFNYSRDKNTSMKNLLTVSALLELLAGLTILGFPSAALELLIGITPEEPTALIIGRVCGAAILSLGVACWFARTDVQSPSSKGLIVSMLMYNIVVMAVLAYAGFGLGLHSMILWPAVAIHVLMALWCARYLLPQNA
jgi:quinol-cytochrome oxidoreductase complex cytochrome b subunit